MRIVVVGPTHPYNGGVGAHTTRTDLTGLAPPAEAWDADRAVGSSR